VYRLLTLTLSAFCKFSHFFSTIFFLCSVELSAPLHQLVLFVAWSCPFLFINFLVTFELSTKVFFPIHDIIGSKVSVFIYFVKRCFYMVQISLPIYLFCNFSEYFQFFLSYNFISNTKIHCIFSFFFYSSNSCTLH